MNARLKGKPPGNSRMAAVEGKMSFLLCTIFLKSVLINRSPQLFVLRNGAVSFSTDFGRREV